MDTDKFKINECVEGVNNNRFKAYSTLNFKFLQHNYFVSISINQISLH